MFFLPTVTDEYQDVDIPQAEGMELIANSLQDFGKWGRRVSAIQYLREAKALPDRLITLAYYNGQDCR